MVVVKVIGLDQLKELSKNLDLLSPDVVGIAKRGSAYAKSIAPKKTGDLKRGIRYFGSNAKGESTIRSGLPGGSNTRKRPYHIWFHDYNFVKAPNGDGGYKLSSGVFAPKSGIPNYMDVTAKNVSQWVDEDINNKLKKL